MRCPARHPCSSLTRRKSKMQRRKLSTTKIERSSSSESYPSMNFDTRTRTHERKAKADKYAWARNDTDFCDQLLILINNDEPWLKKRRENSWRDLLASVYKFRILPVTLLLCFCKLCKHCQESVKIWRINSSIRHFGCRTGIRQHRSGRRRPGDAGARVMPKDTNE